MLDHEYAKSGRPDNTTYKLVSCYLYVVILVELNFSIFTYRMIVALLVRIVTGIAVGIVHSVSAMVHVSIELGTQ